MQTHSIISNTISEEILQTGHLSIRFMADGFSLLLEDKNYRPVVLNRFTEPAPITKSRILASSEDWLNRHTLIRSFNGEVSIISDSLSSTIIPEGIFSEKDLHLYFEPIERLSQNESVKFKFIKNRPFVIVFPVSDMISSLANKFRGKTRIISTSAILFSMADQINASDHQRGFALIEVQHGILHILMIKNDQLEVSNQIKLNEPENIVYHTLNILKQLSFDREKTPLYYSGVIRTNELNILSRYIRNINPLTYHIQDIDKNSITEHIVLAEASKCG